MVHDVSRGMDNYGIWCVPPRGMDNYGTWCVPRYGQLWYMVCPEVWTTMVHGVPRYGQLWYMVCPEVWTTMVHGVSLGMDNYSA
jgi:hypothetical protein